MIAGVGFCINQKQALTCAHVVNKPGEPTNSPTETEIICDFPLVSPGTFYPASVIFSINDDKMDLAVLQFDSDKPVVDIVSPLVIIDQQSYWDHTFRAFGFPKSIDIGEWVTGRMTGMNAYGWIQIEGDNRPVHFVEEGFSGGPIWDETLNGIVGMMVAVEKAKDFKVAFFIPSAMLAASYPDLLSDSFDAINHRWQVDLPAQYEEREVTVLSPLEKIWSSFMDYKNWHVRVGELIFQIRQSSIQFGELTEFTNNLDNINLNVNYEVLWRQLRDVSDVFRRQTAPKVNRMIARREKTMNVTCSELRRRKSDYLEENEELLLKLDSIRANMRDLRVNFVQKPEYERCFLIIGEMGAGKTFFVNERINGSDWGTSEWVVRIPANYSEPDFTTAVLENIRQSSGINWPDLESIEDFLKKYTTYFENIHPHQLDSMRIVVICDDLSRFGLLHPDFLKGLTQHIRDHTQLHHFIWLLTTPHAYFARLAVYSTFNHSFWARYGFIPERLSASAIDKWIVLDDLDKESEVGLDLIRQCVYEMNDVDSDLAWEWFEYNDRLCDLLCNPFLAWIWLDVVCDRSAKIDPTSHDWHYVHFIEAFWEKQSNLLIKNEFNSTHPQPLNPHELHSFVQKIAAYLKTYGNFYPNRATLVNHIVSEARKSRQTLDIDRAEFTLDVMKHGLILREKTAKSLLDKPGVTVEILFDGFWGLLLANELFNQYTTSPKSVTELEHRFAGINDRMQSVTLNFFLWLVESKNSRPDLPLHYCHLVLRSSTLSHAAVWSTGAKARPQLQRALIHQIKNASLQSINAETLYALLNFLYITPIDVITIPDKYKRFQTLFEVIRKYSLTGYFFYISKRLFSQLDDADELVELMPYLSGCEVMDETIENEDISSEAGITSQLGSLAAKTLIQLVHEGEWISHDNMDESLGYVVSYIARIENNYPNPKAIPGQKKGWRRCLFREWLMYHYLQTMSRFCGVRMYDHLLDCEWYRYRKNRCLQRHMEQEANIALGRLHRWQPSCRDEPPFIEFVTTLAESRSVLNRENAFHIIRHTVPTRAGRHLSSVGKGFVPVLRLLYQDKSLAKLRKIHPFERFFKHSFKHAAQNTDEDDWFMDDE